MMQLGQTTIVSFLDCEISQFSDDYDKPQFNFKW